MKAYGTSTATRIRLVFTPEQAQTIMANSKAKRFTVKITSKEAILTPARVDTRRGSSAFTVEPDSDRNVLHGDRSENTPQFGRVDLDWKPDAEGVWRAALPAELPKPSSKPRKAPASAGPLPSLGAMIGDLDCAVSLINEIVVKAGGRFQLFTREDGRLGYRLEG